MGAKIGFTRRTIQLAKQKNLIKGDKLLGAKRMMYLRKNGFGIIDKTYEYWWILSDFKKQPNSSKIRH